MMKIKQITPPAKEPLQLEDVKDYLKVDVDDDDIYINTLIKTAREYCEKYQNKVYITQTLEMAFDCFPNDNYFPKDNYIEFKRAPVQSITSIKYYDINDQEYTLSNTIYDFDNYSLIPRIVLKYNKYFPTTVLRNTNALIIRYVAGFGDTGHTTPLVVLQAMYLLIAYWYENREAGAIRVPEQIEFSVKALLGLDRVVNI